MLSIWFGISCYTPSLSIASAAPVHRVASKTSGTATRTSIMLHACAISFSVAAIGRFDFLLISLAFFRPVTCYSALLLRAGCGIFHFLIELQTILFIFCRTHGFHLLMIGTIRFFCRSHRGVQTTIQ